MTAKEIKRTLQSEFVRTLRKPFVDAVKAYGLVKPSDKVAVCISGGKDSMLLALLLQDLQHTVDFDLVFLSMDPGYALEGRKHLEENAKRLDIPLEIFDTDVLRVAGVHSAEHPCFLCAKMRRGYLYTEARKRGCNKIALGHHYDDAIGTVLMGLIYGGQVQAMLPRVKAKNYEGMELIRPLYFTREQSVLDWAEYCAVRLSGKKAGKRHQTRGNQAADRVSRGKQPADRSEYLQRGQERRYCQAARLARCERQT